jgi:HD-GYP domain-containing protein (c-di-GMP phosphodiesterase class II)
MSKGEEKLQRVIDIGLYISQIRDIDLLLETILREARRFTNADAGSIYLKEGSSLRFSYTQNETQEADLPPGKKLIYSTFTIPINSHSIAGFVAETGETLNIPDVYTIPATVPYSFNRSFDERTGYRTRSMLTFPLRTSRGEIVGVLQLINARDFSGEAIPFPVADEHLLKHFAGNAAVAVERAKLTRATLLRMNKMAELRDPKETGPHVNRVASYSVIIYENWAQRKGVTQAEIDRNRDILRMAAMLHDVGKVAISDTILKKPARFTPEEFDIMKQHTVMGARLFGELFSDFDEAAATVALNHHERWDGKGYPGHIDFRDGTPIPGHVNDDGTAQGKKGEEIPLFGRVVAVADVYDALSSKRCYKEAWNVQEVLNELRAESGRQFDPELVESFFENIDAIENVARTYPDEEH